ncbi:MAG: radical SAM family heme chaperone HemW [Deltaproteobacteria bacterium]|nr:radical SAM family heme chaperone HemW [Deltaproteobacteria bacterium]
MNQPLLFETPRSDQITPIHGIYIHIPFCRHICPFCSFAVIKNDPSRQTLYLDLLKREFELLKQSFEFDFSQVESIYLGGGTPSVLKLSVLKSLVKWLRSRFLKAASCEFSLEVNPEDVTDKRMDNYYQLGINRISLGLQSFSKSSLKILERKQAKKNFFSGLERMHQAGFKNINLDFLIGYPSQSYKSFLEDMNHFTGMRPEHLSLYILNIEPRTKAFKRPDWQEWQNKNEPLIQRMYLKAVDALEKSGLKQYEVSNFSRAGFESKQNLCNWNGKNYLGMGMGAHSYTGDQRWGNHKRWVDYKNAVNNNLLPREFTEKINASKKRDEKLMIGLRLNKGIDLDKWLKENKAEPTAGFYRFMENLIKNAMAEKKGNYFALTPTGMLLADEIAATLASSCKG